MSPTSQTDIHPETASGRSSPKPSILPSNQSNRLSWLRFADGISAPVLACIGLHFLLAFIEMVQITPLLVLFERAICIQYYAVHDPGSIGSDGEVLEGLCKIAGVQRELAGLRGWKAFWDAIPVLLVAVQVGKLGDRYGRKKALAGSLCSVLGSLAVIGTVCALPHNIPIRYVWFSSIFLFFGGGLLTSVSLMWALASQAIEERERTTAFYYILGAFPLAELFASAIATATTDISPWIPFSLAIIATILSFAVVAIMPVGQGLSETSKESRALSTDEETVGLLASDIPDPVAFSSALSESTTTLDRSGSLTPRPTTTEEDIKPHLPKAKNLIDVFSNPNLFAAIPVFLVGTQRLTLLNVLMQYTSLRFGWRISRTSLFYTETAITNIVLFIILLPRLTKYLKTQRGIPPETIDHMTVRTSVCFLSLGAFCIGLAPTASILPFAVIIYTAGFGSKISTLALVSYYIEDASKAKFYAAIAVLENVGHGLGDPVIQHIFAAVVEWGGAWLATPFFVEGVLYGVAAMFTLLIRTARAR